MDTGSLTLPSHGHLTDCKGLEEDVTSLWELSRNISKAQELFLVKLLEMDMVRKYKLVSSTPSNFGKTLSNNLFHSETFLEKEHERDNKTVRKMLMFVMNRTEDFSMQFLTADERINKILQQFEFTDVLL